MKKIVCDFTKTVGTLRPQHGLCNFPVSTAISEFSPAIEDSLHAKKLLSELHPTVIRLKDHKHIGYGKGLEVPYIFRDFSKDPDDPANYYFYCTHSVVEGARETGADVLYRLGAPREYWKPRFNQKPADCKKWADVCLHIIRHLNEGWADGKHYGIRYWEIWNRADDPQCWVGSYEDYYELYAATATAIKKEFPDLLVGGPAIADCGGDCAFLQGFLDHVKKNGLPCDFVSWNFYGTDAAEGLKQAKKVKKLVEAAKLPGRVQIICDEWNCMTLDENGRYADSHVRDAYGAAFDAAFLMAMEQAGMDFCTYYDCELAVPWGGFVQRNWIKAYKPPYAFWAYNRLYELGEKAAVTVSGKNLTALAAQKDGKKAILAAVCQTRRDTVEIDTGAAGKKTVYVLDGKRDLEKVLTTRNKTVTVPTEGHSVLYIEIE